MKLVNYFYLNNIRIITNDLNHVPESVYGCDSDMALAMNRNWNKFLIF